MIPLLQLLVLHFIGDFLLQSDEMAINKSSSLYWLTQHVSAYTVPFVLYGAMHTHDPWLALSFTFAVFIPHFATDLLTSRMTSALWFFEREDGVWTQAQYHYPKHGRTLVNPWTVIPGKRHWFFVAIGFDQLLHAFMLAGAWWLVMGRGF